MARVSKKNGGHINSTGQKTDRKEKEPSSREQQDYPDQSTIFHFFRPLEIDKKKRRTTSLAGTSRVFKLSSKGKIALRKYKSKKSKAKQLEEIQKYNKKIPMYFDYLNPEKVEENEVNESRNMHGRKSIRSSKKNIDELLKNQRQLTEFYEVIEKISELYISKNESLPLRSNDDSATIRRADSNLEDNNAHIDGSKCLSTIKSETLEISKSTKFVGKVSTTSDNDMNCDSPPIASSRFDLQNSYHLSNFSIEPNDSFITMSSILSSPKVATNSVMNRLIELDDGFKILRESNDENNEILDTIQDNPQLLDPRKSLNQNKESFYNNVTNQVERSCNSEVNRLIELEVGSKIRRESINEENNGLSDTIQDNPQLLVPRNSLNPKKESFCNNVTNQVEQSSNSAVNRLIELEVGPKIRREFTNEKNNGLSDTIQDSPQLSIPRNSLNQNEVPFSFSNKVTNQIEQSRFISMSSHVNIPCNNNSSDQEEPRNKNLSSQVEGSFYNVLSYYVDEPRCDNVQDNFYNNEMDHVEEENEEMARKNIRGNNLIINNNNNSDGNIENNSNCEKSEVHSNHKNESDELYSYSWESEIINFHRDEPLKNKDNTSQKTKLNENAHKQLEKEEFIIQETSVSCVIQEENEDHIQEINSRNTFFKDHTMQETGNIPDSVQEVSLDKEYHISQETDLDEDIPYQSTIDLHCCSQSENKCEFHRIHDLLEKDNYNPDSISTFESFKYSVPNEYNDLSNHKELKELIDVCQLPPDKICSVRSFKDGISPAPSPPSLLSQNTLARVPQAAWNTLPSLNISTLDFDDLL
ncbi:5545_t:CDS:2 [Funneliformis geosporum]|uniref:1770_t:CDS:1 n=1 Tax=Funneliformis geosporum TaxID=1117311 RepID=A0A9W4SG12_9GLOM|nr:1770_t:CDS:2 [Funneliformis geosporum]CAI2169252.1 5545_t:CDS:2 [Funneliformis geosporum]